MNETTIIGWQRDEDGIVTLTMDDPAGSANTLSEAFVAELVDTVARLQHERDDITGVILTSAKRTFFAGGNLNEIVRLEPEDATRFTAHLDLIKAQLRSLETLGRPVVAAINGAALGGGLELALATHHRVAVGGRNVRIGLPEVGLGLLPALGGVTRTVRHLGVTTALDKILLSGRAYTAEQAADLGLVDEVVPTAEELVPAAKRWIAQNPDAAQPWDRKGFAVPGGTPSSGPLTGQLALLSAGLRARTHGSPAPAERAILAAAVEGSGLDLETATKVESRYFVEIATAQIAKNRINLTFFDTQAIRAGASRPEGEPPFTSSRLGVVGAGMMGAGIAYAAAKAGIEVVLVDVSREGAEKGKAYSAKLETKAVDSGRRTQADADALLGRIHPSDSVDDLADVDFVIEAVFENAELKADVFARVEKVVGRDCVLGSNTSTLPIGSLAAAVSRPEDFVGVHFFSPVDRMDLVEIIKGQKTSPRTLARAFDLVRQLGKTPIVVNDSRGFFTSRVIIARLNEAVAMVGEGIAPASIEQASLQAGYPAGALQLLDELTLTLPRAVREEAKAAAAEAGQVWQSHPSHDVFDRLIDEHGRASRASGAGFYDYDESGRRTGLWPGLAEVYPVAEDQPPLRDLVERLLFAEALEAWQAYATGVITQQADANVGSLLGIGFPAWTGGVLRYLEQYDGGIAGFGRRADELAESYGERFRPPASLVEAGHAD
ncbi:fatty oxidation complex, alpha subunit [Nocardioidaceae bacterium Broad-1]|uniref:3-hydroxyacyl-CoA dehydrogenase/enoyl-CoA hydratase/3-hydroxybutyryl-CoA epimerase n=1 Tax=Nocardioides panzhihuensis TaxID=860243 RepID=A0A7Z0ISR9_9ACTN|nr:3-hydroxyacyl-CoA dehydrogenase NAD-binding domain-containing protein [Nocardioides panzhihuensis]EGD43946.1 fatty oxidation complex, alpha subunit [Nocardioidaceae bacterium Broad-1]NYI78216.1 3-hydroxyacyl-CoA dehydrogenase/enoyl-CoA hydratase/3-hydroxybutyryl-CoA epimerase [Nocardioides panzhihuensis]